MWGFWFRDHMKWLHMNNFWQWDDGSFYYSHFGVLIESTCLSVTVAFWTIGPFCYCPREREHREQKCSLSDKYLMFSKAVPLDKSLSRALCWVTFKHKFKNSHCRTFSSWHDNFLWWSPPWKGVHTFDRSWSVPSENWKKLTNLYNLTLVGIVFLENLKYKAHCQG